MFTGIIEATGHIRAIRRSGTDAVLTIDTGKLDLSDVKLGDSIATNGVCLTVTGLGKQSFDADVSGETIKRTTFADLQTGAKVNLEKAMLLTTRLGGHLVSGHVDGIGRITDKQPMGNAVEYWVEAPDDIGKYIAEKGSITVDGISLTVNDVRGNAFKLTIVPHTSEQTTMTEFAPGTRVNLEVDVIARYVERLMNAGQASENGESGGVTMALLASSGFIKN